MAWECSPAEVPSRARFEAPACALCGGSRCEVIATPSELREQARYLKRFHRQRMDLATPPEMLADKSRFTQSYLTNVVACSGCGLVFRSPRPTGVGSRKLLKKPSGGCFPTRHGCQ